jgi:hypothetical protein
MNKRGARTVMLGLVATAALVYCSISVFGATIDVALENLLLCAVLVAMAFAAALLFFILIRIFSGPS